MSWLSTHRALLLYRASASSSDARVAREGGDEYLSQRNNFVSWYASRDPDDLACLREFVALHDRYEARHLCSSQPVICVFPGDGPQPWRRVLDPAPDGSNVQVRPNGLEALERFIRSSSDTGALAYARLLQRHSLAGIEAAAGELAEPLYGICSCGIPATVLAELGRSQATYPFADPLRAAYDEQGHHDHLEALLDDLRDSEVDPSDVLRVIFGGAPAPSLKVGPGFRSLHVAYRAFVRNASNVLLRGERSALESHSDEDDLDALVRLSHEAYQELLASCTVDGKTWDEIKREQRATAEQRASWKLDMGGILANVRNVGYYMRRYFLLHCLFRAMKMRRLTSYGPAPNPIKKRSAPACAKGRDVPIHADLSLFTHEREDGNEFELHVQLGDPPHDKLRWKFRWADPDIRLTFSSVEDAFDCLYASGWARPGTAPTAAIEDPKAPAPREEFGGEALDRALAGVLRKAAARGNVTAAKTRGRERRAVRYSDVRSWKAFLNSRPPPTPKPPPDLRPGAGTFPAAMPASSPPTKPKKKAADKAWLDDLQYSTRPPPFALAASSSSPTPKADNKSRRPQKARGPPVGSVAYLFGKDRVADVHQGKEVTVVEHRPEGGVAVATVDGEPLLVQAKNLHDEASMALALKKIAARYRPGTLVAHGNAVALVADPPSLESPRLRLVGPDAQSAWHWDVQPLDMKAALRRAKACVPEGSYVLVDGDALHRVDSVEVADQLVLVNLEEEQTSRRVQKRMDQVRHFVQRGRAVALDDSAREFLGRSVHFVAYRAVTALESASLIDPAESVRISAGGAHEVARLDSLLPLEAAARRMSRLYPPGSAVCAVDSPHAGIVDSDIVFSGGFTVRARVGGDVKTYRMVDEVVPMAPQVVEELVLAASRIKLDSVARGARAMLQLSNIATLEFLWLGATERGVKLIFSLHERLCGAEFFEILKRIHVVCGVLRKRGELRDAVQSARPAQLPAARPPAPPVADDDRDGLVSNRDALNQCLVAWAAIVRHAALHERDGSAASARRLHGNAFETMVAILGDHWLDLSTLGLARQVAGADEEAYIQAMSSGQLLAKPARAETPEFTATMRTLQSRHPEVAARLVCRLHGETRDGRVVMNVVLERMGSPLRMTEDATAASRHGCATVNEDLLSRDALPYTRASTASLFALLILAAKFDGKDADVGLLPAKFLSVEECEHEALLLHNTLSLSCISSREEGQVARPFSTLDTTAFASSLAKTLQSTFEADKDDPFLCNIVESFTILVDNLRRRLDQDTVWRWLSGTRFLDVAAHLLRKGGALPRSLPALLANNPNAAALPQSNHAVLEHILGVFALVNGGVELAERAYEMGVHESVVRLLEAGTSRPEEFVDATELVTIMAQAILLCAAHVDRLQRVPDKEPLLEKLCLTLIDGGIFRSCAAAAVMGQAAAEAVQAFLTYAKRIPTLRAARDFWSWG